MLCFYRSHYTFFRELPKSRLGKSSLFFGSNQPKKFYTFIKEFSIFQDNTACKVVCSFFHRGQPSTKSDQLVLYFRPKIGPVVLYF